MKLKNYHYYGIILNLKIVNIVKKLMNIYYIMINYN